MKQLQITILFIFAAIASVSAQRIEFEYNEFGECVVRRSPCVIENLPVIKQYEDVKPSKKVVSYHPNPITDYLEIEFSKGSYKVILADISSKKISEFDDVAESLSIDFSELTSSAYIIKVSGNFGDYVRTSHNGLFMHEYGHTSQERRKS
jgi:hypothetical protein